MCVMEPTACDSAVAEIDGVGAAHVRVLTACECVTTAGNNAFDGANRISGCGSRVT